MPSQLIATFLHEVSATWQTGKATEHSYRSALKTLIDALDPDICAINEPKRIDCGAPDFIIQCGDLVIGHVEAKDIGICLRGMKDANRHQQERYRKALPNLIYTNCLEWDFYRDGELVDSVRIADYLMGIQPAPSHHDKLETLLRDFIAQKPQSIVAPRDLAQRMAGKAALIKDILHQLLSADKGENSRLMGEYKAFREQLIHDISLEDFADLYAETIAYGLFAARLHDDTPDDFSRREALDLLPKSNPFLRSFFGYIAGPDLDDGVKWIIDDLAAIFQVANMPEIMAGFGKFTGQRDPFLHFYETFLAAYNPTKRKARGVWYTPEAVVNFIVRAVDQVLQTEFGLPDGLADTSQVSIDWDTGHNDKKGKPAILKKSVHRVQVLDPATGTGTFLAEVIKQIAPKIKHIAPGHWTSYIEQHLIPRLHGFELLMASYAMCHLKLDMILTELGYRPGSDAKSAPPRLSVYLTNSLEEGEREVRDLFMAQWLTQEARAANDIKRQTPIMCVIGNPPYSGISQNMEPWITGLIDDYKYVNGKHFGERKHWLHDDYVKFIRLAEHLIEKNGEGVIGFITNHGYLDNPTFCGMRWHLLNTFDKLYVLDLHGNSKKKEIAPDGSADKNVFDIQQGVSILIAIKKRQEKSGKKALAQVFHSELWGKRENKYSALFAAEFAKHAWQTLQPLAPLYLFVPQDSTLSAQYNQGFSLPQFMPKNVSGIVSMGDGFAIADTPETLSLRLQDLLQNNYTAEQLKQKYGLGKNYADWILENKGELAKTELEAIPVAYRPFDTRWTYFDNRILWRWREQVMRHLLPDDNVALVVCRQSATPDWSNVFASDRPVDDSFVSNRTKERGYCLPLYLYPTEQDLDQNRRVNFDPKLYAKLQKLAKHPKHGTPDEVQVFDYIYGVLHCPAYRQAYAEFLKSDFPRIPWPTSPDQFWSLAAQGESLRRLHLMQAAAVGDTPYPFIGEGEGKVDRLFFKGGQVWINDRQYFDAVPEAAWQARIGGYQPAQKWLKDRMGRKLDFDDMRHYQRIIKILSETDRIMQHMESCL